MKYIDRFKNIEAFLNSEMQQLTGDRIATIEGFELPILKKKTKTVIDPSTNAEVEELQDVWMVPVGEVEKKVEHDYKVYMRYNNNYNNKGLNYYELGSIYHEYHLNSISTDRNREYIFAFKVYDNEVEVTSQIKTTFVSIVENNSSFSWATHSRPNGNKAYDFLVSNKNTNISTDCTTKMRVTFTFDDDSTYSQDFDFVHVAVPESTMDNTVAPTTHIWFTDANGVEYPFVWDSTNSKWTLTRSLSNYDVDDGKIYHGFVGGLNISNDYVDYSVYIDTFTDTHTSFSHNSSYIFVSDESDYKDNTTSFTSYTHVTGISKYKQNEYGEFYMFNGVNSRLSNYVPLELIFVIGNGGVADTFEIDPSFGMNDYEAPLTGSWGLSSRFYTPKYNDASVSWNDVSYNSISCQRLDNGAWVTDSSANVSVSTGTDPKFTINWSDLNTSTYYKLLAEFEYNSIPTIYSLILATTSTAPTPQPTITYVLGTSNGLADNSATLNITNNTAGNDSAASKVFNNLVLWNTDGNGGLVEVNGSYYQPIDYESNFTAVMSSTNPNGAGYDYSLGADNITFFFGDQNDATINADTTAEYTIQFTYNGYTMYYTVTCVWGNGGSGSTPDPSSGSDPSTGTTIVPVLGTTNGVFDNYYELNIPNGTAGNAGASSKNFNLVLWNTDGNGALVEVNGSNYQTIDVNDVSVSVTGGNGTDYNVSKLTSSIDVYFGDQNDSTNNANKSTQYLVTFTYNDLVLYYTVKCNWVGPFQISPNNAMNDYASGTGSWSLNPNFTNPTYNGTQISWDDVTLDSVLIENWTSNTGWQTDTSGKMTTSDAGTGNTPRYSINWSGLSIGDQYRATLTFGYNSEIATYTLEIYVK